jgi:hypothetical protein
MSTNPELAAAKEPESRGAFGGFIGPRTLVGLVEIAAPFLFDSSHGLAAGLPTTPQARLFQHGLHPLGWWSILQHVDLLAPQAEPTPAARTDYFALCLAAHFASVATYVPTDVDAKIRHALWFESTEPEELAHMRELAMYLKHWDVRGVSARIVDVPGVGAVSGHDGERLSVLCGGLLAFASIGDLDSARAFEDEIDAELAREARAFNAVLSAKNRELDLLRLAVILTHNAGDVMQGLAAKSGRHVDIEAKARFSDLARERFERYDGAFGRAALLYRELLAAEGHRNYPLREVKFLRADPALLLPIGPCLDDWGARLARWPRWNAAQRAEVVSALVDGSRKVKGQESYYRALAGFSEAQAGGIDARELAQHYTTSVRRELKNHELRRKVELPRASFEASLAKRARTCVSRRLA